MILENYNDDRIVNEKQNWIIINSVFADRHPLEKLCNRFNFYKKKSSIILHVFSIIPFISIFATILLQK